MDHRSSALEAHTATNNTLLLPSAAESVEQRVGTKDMAELLSELRELAVEVKLH